MSQPPIDDHVELTVQRMAELHAAHREGASGLQKSVAKVTSAVGHPLAVLIALILVLTWIGVNALAQRSGVFAFDPPPFPLLELAATLAALFTTLIILATQRLEDQGARHRSQLTLQLASLSEQKIAKVIQLLEEQRRDSPQLKSRPDVEADAMGQTADPRQVLDRIKDTHEEG